MKYENAYVTYLYIYFKEKNKVPTYTNCRVNPPRPIVTIYKAYLPLSPRGEAVYIFNLRNVNFPPAGVYPVKYFLRRKLPSVLAGNLLKYYAQSQQPPGRVLSPHISWE